MDLRWLSAPEHEVAEAMACVRRESRPRWMPTMRQILVHVNHCLMLWYLCVVWMILGVRIDTLQGNRFETNDIRDIVVSTGFFLLWGYGTFWLYRWAARPPSARSRMLEWRQTLTALANGFAPQPTRRAQLVSLITDEGSETFSYPRFVAPGIEFGNLAYRKRRAGQWRYLAVTLRVPLPHLILDSTETNGVLRNLPVHVTSRQRLSLEGDFDRWFRLYVPMGYERDALFVISPEVMAALVDHAHRYSIEILGDTVIFFAPETFSFAEEGSWLSVEALLSGAVPPLVASGSRYRDERIPEQNISRTVASVRALIENPGVPWVEPTPRIGPAGQRLDISDRRTGVWSVLGAIGWFATLVFLYPVPGIFAFAGFMSVADGW